MIAAKISSKGQLVVPKKIRAQLNIKSGMFFKIQIQKGKIVLTPIKKSPLEQLYGKFEDKKILDDLEREHSDEIQRENRS